MTLSRPRAGEDPNAQLKIMFKQAFSTAESDTGKNNVQQTVQGFSSQGSQSKSQSREKWSSRRGNWYTGS